MGSVHARILTKPSRASVAVSRSEMVEPSATTCVVAWLGGVSKRLERARYDSTIILTLLVLE